MGRKQILNKTQVLQAIQRSVVHRGISPTIEELRKELGVGSTRTVLRYLRQLQEEGYIKRWTGARGIKLLKGLGNQLKTRAVPILGAVRAGPLMLAEENLEGWIRLPETQISPTSSQFFFLRITGDSMNRAKVAGVSIEDGDLVLVRQQSAADSGQIVVALIDGEATVKRLSVGVDYFVLKPESTNKEYQPILLDRDTLIQGVVTRVLKNGSAILDDERG